jgi:trimeric autotransporter adhesin
VALVAVAAAFAVGQVADLLAASGMPAAQTPAAQTSQVGCRVTGKVITMVNASAARPNFGQGQGRGAGTAAPAADAAPTKVEMPLPGATIVVHQGARLVVATSTEVDGQFAIRFTPGQTFHVTAEMMSFANAEKDITLGAVPCDTTLNFELSLLSRTTPIANPTPAAAPQAGAAPTTGVTPPAAGQAAGARAGAPGTRPAAAPAGRGFAQLNVTADANGEAATAASPIIDQSAELAKFLPPGFSVNGASAEAISVNTGGDAINVDRGMLNDRMGAIGRGEFDPATGQFSDGFAPQIPGAGGGDQGGGRGGGFGGGGRGGPGGGFALGGRGGRGQNLYQGSVNYTYGGSALNTTAIQPRNGIATPVPQLPYAQNSYGGTIGGPLIIPGIYKDTKRRTNFQLNYSGNHSTNVQDQYATVPSDAMRTGDFSAAGIQLIDPTTGKPFTNNQIPISRMDPAALALLQYIPTANVPGATIQNLHTTGTTLSKSNSISVRLNQNLTPNLPEPGARGAGPRGGGGGGRGGAGGRGGRGLTINLSTQLQYRGNSSEQFNVIPSLAGTTKGTSIAVPVSLNVSKGRTNNTFSVNVAHTNNTTTNGFSNNTNVAGLAGILYPTTQDPLNWGVPNLSFSNFSVRPSSANVRTDTRVTVSYTLSKPIQKHQLRFGVDFRHDGSSSESNGNARGSFTFSGLYTGNGALAARNTGADVADFLLGMPQLATLQVGGLTRLRERTFDTYVEDNWQRSARMTFNLGLRWEVSMPYVEVNGQMANLDVTPGFTAASVVTPGQTSALSGTTFPAGLLKTDWNNIGPRVGMAYRLAKGTILNTSYSITYNAGSYASIARNLVGQPPFAVAETNPGSIASPLSLETGLVGAKASTTNNYGVDPNFGLGMIQTWNATIARTFWRTWTATIGYTGTRGTSLDLLRAPNRNPDGTLRIAGVQAFTWESSGGHSLLSLGNISIQRGMARGLRFGASYTLAKSMDNASSLGAGGATVAQNDQDLGAEWALSNFDRRHQFSANMTYELPFGVGRKWLSNGGFLAALMGEWSMNVNVSAQSGTPFTPRVVGATTSVANGTSGSLRANYSGAPISLSDPSLLGFFDTSVFSIPAAGTFGTSPRNVIIGPGGHVANASFTRDMRIGGNRAVSLQINANNLFNTIQWTAIDTNINSNTFGQVTRFAGMRTITLNMRLRF